MANSKISTDNPLGILAIDHLEFTCASLETKTKELFYTFGFEKSYENKETNEELFSQGQVRFLLVEGSEGSHQRKYFNDHGEGVSTISFLVEDCEHAINEAVKRGATKVQDIIVTEVSMVYIKRLEFKVLEMSKMNSLKDQKFTLGLT